ncbi:hypothetical protein B0H11DRAFT_1993452 [Mycena galericulata]|nr:hypothetical protein B0H11DRAFT_1993452 [Mycena galericulata]
MRRHQAAQLQQALEQAQADAEMVAYQQHQAAVQAQADFYHHQQQQQAAQEQELRIEEERYHMQQLQQQRAPTYLDPYAPHPHPPSHALEMGMGSMPMGAMEMMEGYPPHPGNMVLHPLDMEAAGAYHSHSHHQPHIEADSPALGYPGDSPEYHTPLPQHPHPHSHSQQHPHPHPQHPHSALEHPPSAGSPASPYSLAYPPTPLGYHFAETMPSSAFGGAMMGFAMRPEDTLKYESSPLGPDADLGPVDMNMNMSMNMGIGLGVGGAAG